MQAYNIYYLSKRCDQKLLLSSDHELRKCHFAYTVKLVPPQGNRVEKQLKAQGVFSESWPRRQCCMKRRVQEHLACVWLDPWVCPLSKASWQIMAKRGNVICKGQIFSRHDHYFDSCYLQRRAAGFTGVDWGGCGNNAGEDSQEQVFEEVLDIQSCSV